MTFHDLIERVSDHTKFTRREIRHVLKVTAQVILEELLAGRDVAYTGLGIFENVPAKARIVMDPKTKTHVTRPATRRVKFLPCRYLKVHIHESQKLFVSDLKKHFGLKED